MVYSTVWRPNYLFRFKDKKEILTPSDKYIAQYNDGVAELCVKDIVEGDAGAYTMRATNEIGSIDSKAKMAVEASR